MTINIDGGQSTNEFYKRCAFYPLYYLLPFRKKQTKKKQISNTDNIKKALYCLPFPQNIRSQMKAKSSSLKNFV